MKSIVLFFLGFICISSVIAQPKVKEDSLCKLCELSRTEEDKVTAFNNLANYYYNNKYFDKGDSVLSVQLHIAELSNNKDLILKTYFDNYITGLSNWSPKQNFEKASQFILQGIEFAKSINNYDYMALGYSRMASILRKRGDNEKAVENANMALMTFQNIKSDSIKAIVYMVLGDCYHSKGESVQACKSYNNAFDIAFKSKNVQLQSDIYYRLENLYFDLGDLTETKRILLMSVGLNKKFGNNEALIRDYSELARATDDTFYVQQALLLSDSLHYDNYKLRTKSILFAIYMTKLKDSKRTLDYLNSQADLKENMMQGGIANYYFTLGEIYRYADNPDSALYYFKLAEPSLVTNFDAVNSKYEYSEMAVCYDLKHDSKKAIYYYEKTLDNCKGDLYFTASISNALSGLYKDAGDYEKAFNYKVQATNSQDSVTKLSKEKDIALLDVARETRKHEIELDQEAQRLRNSRNLQYMAITIAISIIFLGMLFIGMFAVSKLVIKILGYFFFISLFEFIVMLLDNSVLNSATQGQPLKLWVIKIGLIGLLVPFQHFLETTLIRFLSSRKLLEARTRFSIGKWWTRMKKNTAPEAAIELDKDAAVL